MILFFSCWIFSGGGVYTTDFKWPHKNKSCGVRSGDLAGHSTSPLLPIHFPGNIPSSHCRTGTALCGGAPSCLKWKFCLSNTRFPSLTWFSSDSVISGPITFLNMFLQWKSVQQYHPHKFKPTHWSADGTVYYVHETDKDFHWPSTYNCVCWEIHLRKNILCQICIIFNSLRHLFTKFCSFSNLSATSTTSQLILQPFRRFNYRPHSPTLPLLHLRHSSFSNPSFASPTSQALHLIHLASRPWCYEHLTK